MTINGRAATATRHFDVINPSTGEVHAQACDLGHAGALVDVDPFDTPFGVQLVT